AIPTPRCICITKSSRSAADASRRSGPSSPAAALNKRHRFDSGRAAPCNRAGLAHPQSSQRWAARSRCMGLAERAIAEIEDLAGQDVQQRNIGPLVAHVRGSLAAAAGSIVRHSSPSIGIITGFYLLDGEPPNCETDGPPGAAMLAAGFAAAGIPCRIATDLVNAKVLLATADAADLSGRGAIDVVSMRERGGDGGTSLADV